MFDPQMELLSTVLIATASNLPAEGSPAEPWIPAKQALSAAKAEEPELFAIVESHDAEALRAVVAGWVSGKRLLPEQDREVLKRAMKAFRKSLKVTRLDADSGIGGGPMSSGRHSDIVGITPPPRYPRPVWDELVRQGRLRDGRRGIYELPPE